MGEGEDSELTPLAFGLREATFRLCACIGTMNQSSGLLPLTRRRESIRQSKVKCRGEEQSSPSPIRWERVGVRAEPVRLGCRFVPRIISPWRFVIVSIFRIALCAGLQNFVACSGR